ncbi:type II toxin-antitoxin system MqsA family antitoxin [Paraburkholderia fungorum]|uniref:Type II toxin-antitoxin system MqsA family antitoxin n=1 Tax=Paraburkholderia fungorum TaxID=134537 RepID=A0AAP5QC43_9BURK|nr:type II toxin-antitoxin system MqsA family antitoxin [Paraburkholderia fungorum]MDT8841028.1 type II toxin-antitoxin system MqsA family antitoxin [Paraburkholderia fungorum]PRZ56344.1 putative zinc finger/helix-turn-helix YgiT family protein [Paraburkholderia fungorum]USU14205.1 type II toxin-antitoxin system MqsA family antitoxin [Paraburkholderia fungorum]USU22153.1 type II toxin-antitoxin system MqsA family antitoxin [Paraburkholderia fungorum]
MNAELGLCPLCGEGQLHRQRTAEEVTENGVSGLVDMQFEVCDSCGGEMAGKESARANKRAISRFRKHAAGLLVGDEIAEIRRTYELRQEDAAVIFGGGPVAFSKYECDDVAQSVAMDKTLRVCSTFPPAFFQYAELAGQDHLLDSKFETFVDRAARNIVASGAVWGIDLDAVRGVIRASMNPDIWTADEPAHDLFVSDEEKSVSRVTVQAVSAAPPVMYGKPFVFSFVEEWVSSNSYDERSLAPPLLKAA